MNNGGKFLKKLKIFIFIVKILGKVDIFKIVVGGKWRK